MKNRLYNLNPFEQPPDAEIMRRAKGLRIDLWADKDGDIHGDVRINCSFGIFSEEEDFDGSKQAEALAFAQRVLDAFRAKKGTNGDGGCSHV